MKSVTTRFSTALYLIFIFFAGAVRSQTDEPDEKLLWADNKPIKLPAEFEKYANSDLVILDEKTDIHFYVTQGEYMVYTGKILCNMLVKINTAKGLTDFKTRRLPESFDNAYEANLFKQGRQARIKIPYTHGYKVKQFIARKFSENKWQDVSVKDSYSEIRWISGSGAFMNEDITNYNLQGLEVGDVVQVYYEAKFTGTYGSNIFYFYSSYPKLNCEYSFIYPVHKSFESSAYLFPVMVADSCISRSLTEGADFNIHTDKIKLRNQPGINYPANSFEGRSLPHVCIDFSSRVLAVGANPNLTSHVRQYKYVKPKNFEWMLFMDTNNYYTKIYDKHFAAIRKFVATMPPTGSDSANFIFFRALCDTFNEFRFMSMNHLFYNDQNLYAVSSGDHLLKRRIAGGTWSLYRDILNDDKIFYYLVNIQDKRYGEHSRQFRAHEAYERNLVAIPYKDSYIYFTPRYAGMKYHLNELPFYYEGVLGVMMPKNFQKETEKDGEYFKFIRTHKGTFNENTRTENATVAVSLDSLTARFTTKESLSGQFSTVLRHLYLNDYIDSTIAPYYFKKCTAKPGVSAEKIKLSSKITEYPFRYTFNCSEKVKLASAKELDLNNWFSFILSKETLPEIPTHEYHFDFEFSDSYNFLLKFGAPVELSNAAAFAKKISSELFELESEIVKNSDSDYLLRVRVSVKQPVVRQQDLPSLMELVKTLDELNSFSLQVVKK